MLSCKELVARSSDFLDGQLDFRGQLAVRSHLLMCRHCRRFIRQMRLTRRPCAICRKGRGRNSTAWPRISPNCARTPRGAEPGYPRHQAAARDSWAAAFSFPLSGVGEPNPAWHGWLSLPRDEVEECGWAWRISLRDMHPTEGRQSVSLGEHPKLRRTPGTWRISPTDISPAGAIPEFRQRDGKFFSTPL